MLSLYFTKLSDYSVVGIHAIMNNSSSVIERISALSINKLCISLISVESNSKLSFTETLSFPWHKSDNAINEVSDYDS
jgi:hypothetical protein